jgi:type 2 lantibiotic biosynthesis protein LanM
MPAAIVANAARQLDRPSPVACPLPARDTALGQGIAGCLTAFAPLIQEARDDVRAGICELARTHGPLPFDPDLIEESLASGLADPLIQMTARVMVLELNVARLEGQLPGDTPQDRFMGFVDRLQDPAVAGQLFAEYPVLIGEIGNRLARWSAFSLEFLKHFCEDREATRNNLFDQDPGPLVSVYGGAGDTHRGGRSVMILTFAGGARVVYKPRPLAVEEHFQQLLLWLNAHGAEPAFRPLRTFDRASHGWAEFVDTVPCANAAEADRFYQRQGGYLALLFALGASDLHAENLIACGEHPILVDLEAMFHHRPALVRTGVADELAGDALNNSVFGVGLLPMRIWANADSGGVDMSGLGGGAGQMTPHGVPQWERTDTDEMHLVRKQVVIPGAKNRPVLGGRALDPGDYTESIAKGFADMYALLLRHRGEMPALLREFANDEVRIILRPTQTYGALLYESFHPDLLRCEVDRLAFLDRLQEGAIVRPDLSALVAFERHDLIAGDIPMFTTRPSSRYLFTSKGEVVENYFLESGIAAAERRIDELSEKDLERQLWVIRASISSIATSHANPRLPRAGRAGRSPDAGVATPRQLIDAARAIGDRIGELAFGGTEDAAWIGLVPATDEMWNLSPLGPDLYDGLPGVILFLAYLGFITGERRYTALGQCALVSLRRQMEKAREAVALGGFNGWGGIIYALTHLGVIWHDHSLFAEAESLLNGLPELIDHDGSFDVIGGSAGLALALWGLSQYRPSGHLLEIAQGCGERLIRCAQPAERGVGWLCGRQATTMLTGFAHGNAGIACALLKIAEMTGGMHFGKTALDALEYERSLFSEEHGNWPDLREGSEGEFAIAWCHGAPGIALSRLCALDNLEDPRLRDEIDVALNATFTGGFGGNHTLCHGDLGNADILLYAAEVLGMPAWRDRAHQIVAAVLCNNDTWVCGNPLGVESPGLMTGIAGIGYALLRFADPDRIPSVLSLEPPVWRNESD